jgi:hypothetical protein
MLLIEKFTKTLYFIFQTCEYNRTSVDSDIVCIDDDDDDEANFETTENLQTQDHFHYDEDLQTPDNFKNAKNETSSDETESLDSSSDSAIEARTTKKKVFLKKSEKNRSNHKTSSSESEDENANSVSSLSKKECVNVKSSKQNKTFSKKLKQNSSDSKDDNDLISESSKNKNQSSEQLSFKEQKKMSKESESNSESSSSEDEQEPIAKPIKTKEKSFKESILPNQRKASNKSSSDSETSSSEDESDDEPSRFIKKYFKLFSSKPIEKHEKSSSNSSSSEDEQESISEPLKSSKEYAKPSTKEPKNTSSKAREHYQISSNIETSSSEDESITEPSKSTKKSSKPTTKEPKNISSKIPEIYQRTSSIETSSSEDDEQQTISELSDSNKKSTKNQSCSKSSVNPKRAKTSKVISSTTSNETSSKTSKEISLKTSKEISSKTSSETSSKTSDEISSTSSSETSSSSDDEEKLIHEPSNSAKPPMTSSHVKQPLSKLSKEVKKDSSKTLKQISSKTSKQISSKPSKQNSSKTSEQNSSKTPKQLSSNIESSSSESEPDSILPPVKPKKKPAKKTNKKSTFENDSEKSYEDFSPIMDGYGDLLDHLNPEDPKSEVDKVVKYILDKNIQVHHINIALCRFTNVRAKDFADLHKKMPFIKIGRYSPGDFGDDDRLIKRWNELVETVPIIDPNQCIVDFSQLKTREVLKKRNVLGCFLGQDLPNVRHCADVFQHACSLLKPLKSGKFSKDEDKIILEEAKKFGPCLSTWKRLILKLNRKNDAAISRRYATLTEERSLFRGMWSLIEEEVLLESLFTGRKKTGIDEIKEVSFKDFQSCSEQLNRSNQYVSAHWRHIVMPILLSYHYGTLHRPWRREFFEYLVEKKVAAVQDIDYSEASSFWPEQSHCSFINSLRNFGKKQAVRKKPLFQIIEENLHSFKDPQENERVRNYREEIVRIYDEVKNRTIETISL